MNNVIKVLEVNMVDLLPEYANPDDVQEWKWVEIAARFSHVGNDIYPGVWEFMVLADIRVGMTPVPTRLQPAFAEAADTGCYWILFHQG